MMQIINFLLILCLIVKVFYLKHMKLSEALLKGVRCCSLQRYIAVPMMPKAREMTQHGSPPGWLEECDPAG
jgi:hypothetical protein